MLFYYQSQALWNQAGKASPKITEKALVFYADDVLYDSGRLDAGLCL